MSLERYIKDVMCEANVYTDSLINFDNYNDDVLDDYVSDFLFENSGMFPGCQGICKRLVKLIRDNKIDNDKYQFHEEDFKGIPIFFKSIYITVTNDKKGAGYVYMNKLLDDEYDLIRWDNENKIFNFIEIQIGKDCFYEYDTVLFEMLAHELTHSYVEYRHLKNNGKFLKRLMNSDNYKKLDPKRNDHYIVKTIKIVLHTLEPVERNSILAQLVSSIYSNEYVSLRDAYEDIKKSPIYQNIKAAYALSFLVDKDEEIKRNYILAYRHIYNDNIMSDKKILNFLKKESNKLWKKAINHIYYAIYNDVKIDEHLGVTRNIRRIANLNNLRL